MNGFDYEKKRKENRELIELNSAAALNTGRKIIANTLKKNLSGYNERLKKIPEVYQGMKNNLTNTNNKELKKMQENIANTGNHTAGGYAISKRLNNINSFNRAQSDIDKAKQNEISDIKNKMAEARADAEIQSAKLARDISAQKLNMSIEENNRDIDFNFMKEKQDEVKRVNDASIAKINNDIILDNNEDKRKEAESIRKGELHDLEMSYLPKKYESDLLKMDADTRLTEEKIKTEGINQTMKKSSGSLSKTSSGGSGSSKETSDLSRMSAKDIASNIINQIGKKQYDGYGRLETTYDKQKAYIYLMEWKKKYQWAEHTVNDAAIILGIQDYL